MNPLIIFAQFAHETGDFTSNIFLNANNVAGMKASVKRKNHNGEYSGHASYDSIWLSIVDYIERQKQFGVLPSSDALNYYTDTQLTGYAEDKSYITKCMGVYDQVKQRLRPYTLLLYAIIIGALYWIYTIIKD